jgi:hypothetical protein
MYTTCYYGGVVSFVRMERLKRCLKPGVMVFLGYDITGEQDQYAH